MSIIDIALKDCPKDAKARREHFVKIVNEACGSNVSLTKEKVGRLIESLKSTETTVCEPGSIGCKKHEETGCSSEEGLALLLAVMLESYCSQVSTSGKRDVRTEQVLINCAQALEWEVALQVGGGLASKKLIASIADKLASLQPGQTCLMCLGYDDTFDGESSGHALYVVWQKQIDGSLLAHIYNLGEGCEMIRKFHLRDVEGNVYPAVRAVSKLDISRHVRDLVSASLLQAMPAETAGQFATRALGLIYKSGKPQVDQSLPGIPQVTGNCVIKNALLAFRGMLLLSTPATAKPIYKALFSGSLSVLLQYYASFDGGMAGLGSICGLAEDVTKSQEPFKSGGTCAFLSSLTIEVGEKVLGSHDSKSKTGRAVGAWLAENEALCASLLLAAISAGIVGGGARLALSKAGASKGSKIIIPIILALLVGCLLLISLPKMLSQERSGEKVPVSLDTTPGCGC